ncbi:FAD-dependent oxidoreductase [Spirochaetota bacterium]
MDFQFNLTTDDYKNALLDENSVYDILIIGGGPAALTAAVYCMRKNVKTGIITLGLGGQVAETFSVENYMGYKYIEGVELVEKFKDQVKQFEIGLKEGVSVTEITQGEIKKVKLEDGTVYQAKAIIICTGKSSRKLDVPGERENVGRGVAYCSTCDAPLYGGKNVAVVGGGNSGLESVIDLAKIATHVTLLQFLDKLTGDKVLIDALNKLDNVDVLLEHEVKKIEGKDSVESVIIKDIKNGEEKKLEVDGIFIEIGLEPNSLFVQNLLELNEFKEIIVNCDCQTNMEGIFAAGDVTTVPYKQIIIAAGEGAKAALAACDYILKM